MYSTGASFHVDRDSGMYGGLRQQELVPTIPPPFLPKSNTNAFVALQNTAGKASHWLSSMQLFHFCVVVELEQANLLHK